MALTIHHIRRSNYVRSGSGLHHRLLLKLHDSDIIHNLLVSDKSIVALYTKKQIIHKPLIVDSIRCTWLEYGSKAISVHTMASGYLLLIIASALGTIPLGLYDSSAKFVLRLSGTFGNRMNVPIPYLDAK